MNVLNLMITWLISAPSENLINLINFVEKPFIWTMYTLQNLEKTNIRIIIILIY